jgi:alkanesulfonate monooxygenase SsuD/methylene tetrahydromethanopterin reductase-like flavin-dependent oxidoreductase (luciferase family)
VRAMEEAIALIRELCDGGEPVTFDGAFYQVTGLLPAPARTRGDDGRWIGGPWRSGPRS